MSRKYEGMIVLDTRGNEGSVQDLVLAISKSMEEEGANLESVEDLGRKTFAYNARKLAAGQYVNVNFSATPESLDNIQEKLELKEEVYMQRYLRKA